MGLKLQVILISNQYGDFFLYASVCCLLCRRSAQQTAYTPFHDMLPHPLTTYNDVILLNVLTEM